MKKKIIIGLGVFSLIFFLGGVYIITTIESATSTLDNLIKLHQVEILREHLLIQIKKVQSNLSLMDTRYARSIDIVIDDTLKMEKVADSCFRCHHAEAVLKKIRNLRGVVDEYKDALSRVLTFRANVRRMREEKDVAFKKGESLSSKVNDMISMASIKLENKTHKSLSEISETKTILYVLVIAGPILTASLGFIFIRGLTKPLNTLLGATRKLKGGNLDYRVEGLKDEFGEVAVSFNEMAYSLKEHMIKMQRAEQMAVLGELAAGLAHEVKNPLAGIKMTVELLSRNTAISDKDRDIVLGAISEIKRIEVLIKSLLNFAKPPAPQLMRTDVNDILEKSLDFSLRYPSLSSEHSRKIDVVNDYDERVPEIMADPLQLQQVFLNLLLNAIDAMPGGGTLYVKTRYLPDKEVIGIEITDTGKGITEEERQRIFRPFFTTKPKGTGLGLAISKSLIEQHGGSIFVENSESGGASFRISLSVNRR